MKEFNYVFNKTSNAISLKQSIYKVGSYHYNWHQSLEMLVVVNGEVEVCTNGFCRILETDDVVLVNSNSGHATLAHKPDSIMMLLHIDPTFLDEYYENTKLLSFDLCSTKESRYKLSFSLIRLYLAEMILSCESKEPEHRLNFESKLYSLMQTVIQYFPPVEIKSTAFIRNQKRKVAIEKMLKYIDKNYKKKITLDMLAKECGYNNSYVSQLFKTSIGINFHDYLTRIRLREATRDLSQTEYNILDIALENGFSDIKSFNSAFKKNFGKSPTDYRKKLNKNIAEIDISFKKQFIPIDDELVNKKLKEYISMREPQHVNLARKDNFINIDKVNNFKLTISELSERLNELTGVVNEVITGFDDFK